MIMKNIVRLLIPAVIAAFAGGCGESRVEPAEPDSRPLAFVCPGNYSASDSLLMQHFHPADSLRQDSVLAMIVQSEQFDTIGVSGMNRIYDYYVGGGTIVFLNPTSRNWLFFWRKMFDCQAHSHIVLTADAADDLDAWRAEAEEVAGCTGSEPVFATRIAYVTGLRVKDFYTQVDSLSPRNMADWITGTPTGDIIAREYGAVTTENDNTQNIEP